MVWGSKHTIDGSIHISNRFGISRMAIGFVLIAVFVSLPDLMVSLIATSQGMTALAVGDALGSTIANICLVIGTATLLRKIKIHRTHVVESAEMLFLISLIPLALLINNVSALTEGLVLLLVFLFYVFFVVKEKFNVKSQKKVEKGNSDFSVGQFLVGALAMVLGSFYFVGASADIARALGISEAVIGLTLVSFGTTLPELIIDFTAIRRGEVALAIGEILGSAVANLTLVLGSAFILSPKPIHFDAFILPVGFIVIANSFLVYNFIKHEGIKREQGVFFLLLYAVFIIMNLAIQV